MPLVVVTSAEEKSRAADAEIQAGELLRLGQLVFESIGQRFSAQSVEVWENFPRSWLGGTLRETLKLGGLRPVDFVVPRSDSTVPIEGIEAARIVHSTYCLAVRGLFQVRPGAQVPARFEINLARRYARGGRGKGRDTHGAGDLVFETEKTLAFPYDGLYLLAQANWEDLEPFVQGLRDRIFGLSEEIESGPRISWASLKLLEGATEPTNDDYFLYTRDEASLARVVSRRIREIAIDRGQQVYEKMSIRAIEVFRDAVDGVLRSLALSHLYDDAVRARSEIRGLRNRTGGSSVVYSDDPTATDKVARDIFEAVSGRFLDELERRLGAVEDFEAPLKELVSRPQLSRPHGLDDSFGE